LAKGEKKAKKKIKPEQYFVVVDGTVLKNLKELAMLFEDISEDVFRHHVTDERNDFSTWIRHVLEDKDLANLLDSERELETFHKKLLMYVVRKHL